MKKYLSIILSLLFLLTPSHIDARRRKHYYAPKKKNYYVPKKKQRRSVEVSSCGIEEGVFGIDVSHYQGRIDWGRVASYTDKKLQFAYIKATEGSTILDDCYERNIVEAKEKGLLVGSYHYFTTRTSAEDQIENFKRALGRFNQDLIPVVDIEECEHWTPDVFHKHFQVFLNELEAFCGKRPIIYTMSFFYNLYLADKYKDYKIFVAQYSGDRQPVLRDGNNWEIWQFSHTGRVDGIRGNVDLNILNPDFKIEEILLTNKKSVEPEKPLVQEQTPHPSPTPQ